MVKIDEIGQEYEPNSRTISVTKSWLRSSEEPEVLTVGALDAEESSMVQPNTDGANADDAEIRESGGEEPSEDEP